MTAKIVEGGKTERELLLERQNAKLTAAIKKTSSIKRQTEEEAARIIRENEKLRAAAQATKEKFSWMGYTNS